MKSTSESNSSFTDYSIPKDSSSTSDSSLNAEKAYNIITNNIKENEDNKINSVFNIVMKSLKREVKEQRTIMNISYIFLHERIKIFKTYKKENINIVDIKNKKIVKIKSKDKREYKLIPGKNMFDRHAFYPYVGFDISSDLMNDIIYDEYFLSIPNFKKKLSSRFKKLGYNQVNWKYKENYEIFNISWDKRKDVYCKRCL